MKLHLLCFLQKEYVQRTTKTDDPRALLTFTITTTTTIIMTDKLLMYVLRFIFPQLFFHATTIRDSDGDMPIFDKQK